MCFGVDGYVAYVFGLFAGVVDEYCEGDGGYGYPEGEEEG